MVDAADHVVIDAGAGSIRIAAAPAGVMRFHLLDAAGALVGTVLLVGAGLASLELRAAGDVTLDPRATPDAITVPPLAPGGSLVLPGDLSPFG